MEGSVWFDPVSWDAHAAVLVVQIDDEAERPASHRLCWDEGVLKGGLSAGRDGGTELQGGEVLDVELVILKDQQNRVRSGGSALLRDAGIFCT